MPAHGAREARYIALLQGRGLVACDSQRSADLYKQATSKLGANEIISLVILGTEYNTF